MGKRCSVFIALALITLVVNCVAGAGNDLRQRQPTAKRVNRPMPPTLADPPEEPLREVPPSVDMNSVPDMIRRLRELTDRFEVCPPGSNLSCGTYRMNDLFDEVKIERDGIVTALGHLHAVEAVPLLIKTLGLRESISPLSRYSGPEVDALVEIGDLAVPELLDNLDVAAMYRRIIEQSREIALGYSEIERRIVDVLGMIGDDRALPALERLKEETTNSFYAADLQGAIDKITRKHQQK